ncbi:MAG TPA: MFS transporter [Solirubrobacterales bacterium]|jgi:predicted MFS family arabinose efflux permease|nr:MFS transporter [Solirubrobacterales bacterium]
MSEATRVRAMPGVLLFVVMVTGIISSLGAPLIPSISDDLGVSLSAAQWSLTATLLVGVVSSPVMGRLGDGPRRRETLLIGLVVVIVGSVVAALAPSLAVLVAGRAMQGVGLGLVPLGMATARDVVPPERVASTIGLLSVAGAAGVGAGYPISGLLAGIDLSAAFWFGAVVAAVALVLSWIFVPSTAGRPSAKLDLPGALLLTVGLSALLIAIAEGSGWGWGAAQTVGLFVVAVVFLLGWGAQQLRVAEPLVDLRLARHPAVLSADVCATVLGIAMYMYLSGVSEFVQAPSGLGYGFSASVVVAGLCLVPFSIIGLLGARLLPLSTRLVGPRNLLPVGCLVVAAGGVVFAVFDDHLWGAFAMMGVLGLGYGLTYAAIPGIIVRSVPESETGSATGFYQVVRYIGFSLGSALAASLLASATPAGSHLPDLGGYTAITWTGVAICVFAAVLARVLPSDGGGEREPTAAELRREEEEGGLASAGLPGVGTD